MSEIDNRHVPYSLIQVVFPKKPIADSKSHRLIYQPRYIETGYFSCLEKTLSLDLSVVIRD